MHLCHYFVLMLRAQDHWPVGQWTLKCWYVTGRRWICQSFGHISSRRILTIWMQRSMRRDSDPLLTICGSSQWCIVLNFTCLNIVLIITLLESFHGSTRLLQDFSSLMKLRRDEPAEGEISFLEICWFFLLLLFCWSRTCLIYIYICKVFGIQELWRHQPLQGHMPCKEPSATRNHYTWCCGLREEFGRSKVQADFSNDGLWGAANLFSINTVTQNVADVNFHIEAF